MIIGIDASRAFAKGRTGIEEYSYQMVKRLTDKLGEHQVVLYLRNQQKVNFELPDSWKVKIIKWPWLWTQIGLSLKMLFQPIDVLFVPAHVVPIVHPRNTIVTIHGLEYEMAPEAYSFWQKLYMRWSIKKSCHWAKKIIAVSKNTKQDLMRLYKVPEDKIEVVYEGVSNFKFEILNFKSNLNDKILNCEPYLLFMGRLEERKNIGGIIEAYKILKEKYNIPHSLVLAGSPGYNYEIIKVKIENYLKIKNLKLKIIELGYVNENLKWQLMSNAGVFLFPTFYEGFGLPILEAQSVGTPVVASNNSSILEVAGTGRDLSVQLVNPSDTEEIAEAAYKLINDEMFRDDIIKKGHENVKRFSWDKCARQIASLLSES